MAAKEVPVGPVYDYLEVRDDAQIRANDYVVDVETQYGKIAVPGVLRLLLNRPCLQQLST